MNILITSAGQRVSLVKAFKKELNKVFPDSKVFTADNNPALAPACVVADEAFKVPPASDPRYISELIELCQANDVRMVVPTIDTELLVLAKNKDAFLSKAIVLVVSDLDFVQVCRNKKLSTDFFVSRGIPVPEVYSPGNYRLPLFIKPIGGSLSQGIRLIKEEQELTDAIWSDQQLLIAEYIDPSFHDEYTVDAYYNKIGDLKCITPRKRIKVRAGEVSKAVTQRNNVYKVLSEQLLHIPGAMGCLTIQVFLSKKDNQVIGIEINPRFGGGYPLSYLAGANFPLMLIREHLQDEPITFDDSWEENLLMLRYDAEVLVHGYES